MQRGDVGDVGHHRRGRRRTWVAVLVVAIAGSLLVAAPAGAADSIVVGGTPNQYVSEGDAVTFTFTATSADPPVGQLQRSDDHGITWTDVVGSATTSVDGGSSVVHTFTVDGTSANSGYRVLWANASATATSFTAYAMTTAPVIRQQPTDQITAYPSGLVHFSGVAVGFTSWQWQMSVDEGVTWANVSSLTNPITPALETNPGVANDRARYRVTYTNPHGSTTSDGLARVRVRSPLVITRQPTLQTGPVGSTVTYSFATKGYPDPSVQWRYCPLGACQSTPIGTAPTLNVVVPAGYPNFLSYGARLSNTYGTVDTALAGIGPDIAPIVTGPSSLSKRAGTSQTWSPTYSLADSYQWQRSDDAGVTWADIPGATAATYTVNPVVPSLDGTRWRVLATNQYGTTSSNPATLTVLDSVGITTQPVDRTAGPGMSATFTSVATGTPTPTVHWQRSADGGATWTDISGATTGSYTLTSAAIGDDGARFRAVYTNAYGSFPTNGALLTVTNAPVITQDPLSQTAAPGSTVVLHIGAQASPTATLQWQRSHDAGATWTDIPGATSRPYPYVVQSGDNGVHLRAVFTNPLGSAATAAAVITFPPPPTITSHPSSLAVPSGSTVGFAFAGSNYTSFQWERSVDSGATWTAFTGGAINPTTGSVTFTASPGANGSRYRVVLTGPSGVVTSNVATLTVFFAPTITSQPSGPAVGVVGQTYRFTVGYTANPAPTFQWQVCSIPLGQITYTCSNITGGGTSSTYTRTVSLGDVTLRWRVILTNSRGSVTSDMVAINVNYPPYISSVDHPPNRTVTTTGTAQMYSTAQAAPAATVQWQRSLDGGVTWADLPGATNQLLEIVAPSVTLNGSRYRLVSTNYLGSVTSNAATLTVLGAPEVVAHPESVEGAPGTEVTFVASAAGNPVPTVQWERSDDGGASWAQVAGATSGTFVTTVAGSDDGARFRAVFTNDGGTTATSPAVLTVLRAQTLTLAALPATLAVGSTFVPTGSASSGLPVSFDASGACALDGPVVVATASGTCSVTVLQPGDATWAPAAPVTRMAPVRGPQWISFGDLPVAPQVGRSLTLAATASSGLPVTYSATGGCSAVNATLKIVQAGSPCIVTARQAGNAYFAPADPVVRETVPVAGSQTITFSSLAQGLSVGSTFNVNASATSRLPVALVATGPCTIEGAVGTMTGSGSCTVTASQAGDDNWLEAPPVSRTTVVRAGQTITFDELPAAPAVGSTFRLAATTSSGLGATYAASGGCVAVGTTLRFTSAEAACTVTASQRGNTTFLPATPVERTTTAVRGAQTITFPAPPSGLVPGSVFTVAATASSGLPVTIDPSGPCSVDGRVVTMTGAGTCVLVASQGGDGSWLPAAPVTRQAIVRAGQVVSFDELPPLVVGRAVTLSATASSGLGVTYSASGACTVVNRTLRPTAAGVPCVVTARQAGNSYFLPAEPVVREAVPVPGPQSIVVASLPRGLSAGASFVVSAAASSGLPVTVVVSGPCSSSGAHSGSTVTIEGSGTCAVTVTQVGDVNWLPAPAVTRTTVVRSSQAITLGDLPAAPAVGSTFVVGGSASSGLGVSYVASGGCTMAGSRITFRTAGDTCTVTATQPGNTYFLPAEPVTRTTTVTP